MECEHEIFCIEEEYISENEINVTMECSLCQTKFTGIIKKR